MRINKQIVESYLGKKVSVELINGGVVVGDLHSLCNSKNYYFVTYEEYNIKGIKYNSFCLFKISDIRSIEGVK